MLYPDATVQRAAHGRATNMMGTSAKVPYRVCELRNGDGLGLRGVHLLEAVHLVAGVLRLAQAGRVVLALLQELRQILHEDGASQLMAQRIRVWTALLEPRPCIESMKAE